MERSSKVRAMMASFSYDQVMRHFRKALATRGATWEQLRRSNAAASGVVGMDTAVKAWRGPAGAWRCAAWHGVARQSGRGVAWKSVACLGRYDAVGRGLGGRAPAGLVPR